MTPLKLLINGAKGRMGQTLISCAAADSELEVAAQVDVGDDLDSAIPECQAVVDFTHADATAAVAKKCEQAGKILVIGITGQDDPSRRSVANSARKIPIVFAPNFSVGVNALFWLARKTAEILGSDFDLEVVEMHHRQKKDAPSGTAKRLAEILSEVRGLSYERDVATDVPGWSVSGPARRSECMPCGAVMWWVIIRSFTPVPASGSNSRTKLRAGRLSQKGRFAQSNGRSTRVRVSMICRTFLD